MKKAYSYIRFSTKGQNDGTSLSRQLELARRYAQERGYELDDSLRDLGKSAFAGDHLRTGALKDFLDKIKSGEIPEGSILIIENVDRLSREKTFDAFDVFKGIIDQGVEIHKLSYPAKEYSRKSLNVRGALLELIGEIDRAHGESVRKSELSGNAWARKFEKLGKGGILTKRCPMWLKPKADLSGFEVYPEVDETKTSSWQPGSEEAINHIFTLYRDGYGMSRITKIMNSEVTTRTDTEGKPLRRWWRPPDRIDKETGQVRKMGQWLAPTILTILGNRAVLGEFQPKPSKTTEVVAEVIPDYYPRVVDEELFDSVQKRKKEMAKLPGRGGGTPSRKFNMFKDTLRCGYCGSRMWGESGSGPHNVVCSAASQNLKDEHGQPLCKASRVRHDVLLKAVLDIFPEFDPTSFFPQQGELNQHIKQLDRKISIAKGRLQEESTKQENLADHLATTPKGETMVAMYEERILAVMAKQRSLKNQIKELEHEREGLGEDRASFTARYQTVQEIMQMRTQKDLSDTERLDVDTRLRGALQSVIQEIRLWPVMPDDTQAAQLRRKMTNLKRQIKALRAEGKPTHIRTKVRLTALKDKLAQLETPVQDREGTYQRHVDYPKIDHIEIRFRSPGVVEDDEYGDTITKRRIWLSRWQWPKDFVG